MGGLGDLKNFVLNVLGSIYLVQLNLFQLNVVQCESVHLFQVQKYLV